MPKLTLHEARGGFTDVKIELDVTADEYKNAMQNTYVEFSGVVFRKHEGGGEAVFLSIHPYKLRG